MKSCAPDLIQLTHSQSKIKDKKNPTRNPKKTKQVKESMSSPTECFTALLRRQNMLFKNSTATMCMVGSSGSPTKDCGPRTQLSIHP